MAAGPSLETMWQSTQTKDVAMLGLDVYNGSQSQLRGYRSRTGVSFPLLQRAAGGLRTFKLGDLIVADRDGTVRYLGKIEVPANRQIARETVTTLLAQTSFMKEDFNTDGKVDFTDFVAFTNAYGTKDTHFDLDASGIVDFADFLTFARVFAQSSN